MKSQHEIALFGPVPRLKPSPADGGNRRWILLSASVKPGFGGVFLRGCPMCSEDATSEGAEVHVVLGCTVDCR